MRILRPVFNLAITGFVFALVNVEPADAEAFVLVKNGTDPAPIVLAEAALPFTREAAEELATAIEKISGAKPAIVSGTRETIPERAIWIGVQPALKPLFPEIDFDFPHPEEILIAATADHLVICGRDIWDPEHLEVEGIDEKIVGKQREYGTANAVYHFIQEYLGVRWLWPGELGADFPERKTIAFEPFEFRHHPPIRGRSGAFNFSRLSNKGYGRSHRWTRRQRLQLDSLEVSGGHGFGDWWERYHETHPEIFALQPDGTRSGHPSPRNVKLCQSNPKVWELWLDGVAEQLEKDPTRTTFNGSPNDGWSSGHCVCESCRAWDHPNGEPRLMHWHHFREERPALSDRHVTFANRLASVLKERYPDKNYAVMMLSYGHSRPAPVVARPAENVIMISVANFYGRTDLVDRGSTWGTTHRDQFLAWSKLAHQVVWRPNTGSPAGWQHGLPDLSVAQTIEDLEYFAENHGVGIYIDAVWEHWATLGPQLYVMAQLLWDPSKNGREILDDYYRRGFGPAADDVRAYFEMMEAARMEFVKEHGYGSGVFNFPRLYTGELLREAGGHLEIAAEKAETSEIYRTRVAFVQAGLDWTALLIENVAAMNAYWQKKDDALARQVIANWETMEQLCQDHPWAINWGPVRPSTPRMIGLHPDYPNPKWKPPVQDLDQN